MVGIISGVSGLVLAVRCVVAAVLVFAAIGKLRRPADLAASAAALGVPRPAATWVARLLPVCEIAIAAGLLLQGTDRLSAAAATALFGAFTVLVAANLLRGNAVPCGCFGDAASRPISWVTVTRNVALTGAAAFCAGPWGASSVNVWLAQNLGVAAVAVVGALLGLLLVLAVAAAARPRTPRQPADGGGAALDVALRDLDQRPARLRDRLSARGGLVVLVLEPGCGPCRALVPDVAAWARTGRGAAPVAAVVTGDREAVLREFGGLPQETVLLDPGRAAAPLLPGLGTPRAVAFSPEGALVGEALGARGITRLIDAHRALAALGRTGLGPGDTLPPLVLPTPGGASTALADLAGHLTVLLFWDPSVRACRDLLPHVRQWHRQWGGGGPGLVVLATGDARELEGQGLDDLALVDDGALRRACGTEVTPSAVLVDAQLRIVSPVAVGSTAVLELGTRAERLTAAARALAGQRRRILEGSDPPHE